MRHSLRLIDDKLRNDVQANQIFLGLLTSQQNPESALRHMSEAGVLGRFVPEFGRVVSMMQFNMYHHYTVDEHLLRTVGQVYEIENGAASTDLPLSTRSSRPSRAAASSMWPPSCTTSARAARRTIRSSAPRSPAGCALASA